MLWSHLRWDLKTNSLLRQNLAKRCRNGGPSQSVAGKVLEFALSNPFGNGIAGWTSSVDGTGPQSSVQPALTKQPASLQEPGGLLGLLLDHLGNNPDN